MSGSMAGDSASFSRPGDDNCENELQLRGDMEDTYQSTNVLKDRLPKLMSEVMANIKDEPLGWSAYGRPHPTTVAIIRRLAKRAARRRGLARAGLDAAAAICSLSNWGARMLKGKPAAKAGGACASAAMPPSREPRKLASCCQPCSARNQKSS